MKTNAALLTTVASAAMLAGPVLAGTFSASTTAPTVDGFDIASYSINRGVGDTFGTGKWFAGNGPDTQDPGQFITTPGVATELTAFTLFVTNGTGTNNTSGVDADFTVTVNEIAGGFLVPIYTESITWANTPTAPNSYITFGLGSNVALDANTQYGIHVQWGANRGAFQNGLPYLGYERSSPNGPYDGGTRFRIRNAGDLDISNFSIRNDEDYVFHANLIEAASPIPSPSAALVGLIGLGGLVARRRRG